MEELTCRLLPYRVADGPTNMATDEALLEAALAGVATLRFYGWSPPTLSLGYFQSERLRLADPLLAALPFVPRKSMETTTHCAPKRCAIWRMRSGLSTAAVLMAT